MEEAIEVDRRGSFCAQWAPRLTLIARNAAVSRSDGAWQLLFRHLFWAPRRLAAANVFNFPAPTMRKLDSRVFKNRHRDGLLTRRLTMSSSPDSNVVRVNRSRILLNHDSLTDGGAYGCGNKLFDKVFSCWRECTRCSSRGYPDGVHEAISRGRWACTRFSPASRPGAKFWASGCSYPCE
jgi:hypothetical protein